VTDLHIAFVTTPQQKFNAMLTYFNLIAVLPCIAFAVMLFKTKAKKEFGLRAFLVFLFLTVGFYSNVYYFIPKFFVYKFPTVSNQAFFRTGIEYAWTSFFSYRGTRDKAESPKLAENTRPNNNIILVVDEAMRGDHFSLNGYSRQTTPYLDELQKQGLLTNWGIAVSSSTCSLQSHDLLITGLTPDDLPDPNDKIKKVPTIFQFAKAMGYKTYYFDGQMNSFWGGTADDLNYIDVWINTTQIIKETESPTEYDFVIAKQTNEIISNSTGNFIFIFKRGNHPPYNLNFPKGAITWTPSFEGRAYLVPDEQLPALVNSFDNAIRYNVNKFFQTLASDYKNLPNNTIIFYTADHSQTLGEDGIVYSHCGYNRKEVIVPLFALGNLGTSVDTKFKPIHANIFPTILDLMNYPESLRKHNYAKSLLKATEKDNGERFFFWANLTRGEKIKFD
jgi:lipid A ethanolaminephosphotransferase